MYQGTVIQRGENTAVWCRYCVQLVLIVVGLWYELGTGERHQWREVLFLGVHTYIQNIDQVATNRVLGFVGRYRAGKLKLTIAD